MSHEGTPEARPTILVVEDDADTRASVAELLEERGYSVVARSDGSEAEEYLRSNSRPDCIVLDLWMPNKDECDFAEDLHRAGGPRIPIVVVTAANPQMGIPVGACHLLRKPAGPQSLLALVADAVGKPT